MIDFYFWTTPNGYKVLIFLEEVGIACRIVPVNISKGEQFDPEFLKISPNNKMPAIVDRSPTGLPDRSRFSSQVPYCYTWQRKRGDYYRKMPRGVSKYFNGYFGKWAVSVRCSDRTCTLASMPPRKCLMRSTAM